MPIVTAWPKMGRIGLAGGSAEPWLAPLAHSLLQDADMWAPLYGTQCFGSK
jgi:hypothetical protein